MSVTFEPILEAAWEALVLFFSWPNFLYPLVGTLLAMVFSFLPGISGVTLMALAIPLTYGWEPLPVMLLFGSLLGGATYMGSLTAILFNIPGSAPNAATALDGYPMAQQGRALTAAGCSATASALGSTFGILVLILLIPLIRPLILAFGPPEVLMLVVWGLSTVVLMTRRFMLKGSAIVGVGLLLAFIGSDPRSAELRYTFGSIYLWDGLNIVPVFLGIFAVAEMMDLSLSGRRTISGRTRKEELSGNVLEGILAVFRNPGLFLRSSVIGSVVGMIPGVGGTVASFVAYNHARQTDKRGRSTFGQGNIRGVLAPEAANDAKDGGSLIPTLALGVPGSAGTALLLAVLTLHGVVPGKELMSHQLPLAFVLIWSLFFSNWITSLLGLLCAKPAARLTVVSSELIVPFVIILATFGAYAYRGQLEDVVTAYVFGVVGYFMKKHGWGRIPLVTAFILGALFEENLHITLRLYELGRIDFLSRPIVICFAVLSVLSLTLRFLKSLGMKENT